MNSDQIDIFSIDSSMYEEESILLFFSVFWYEIFEDIFTSSIDIEDLISLLLLFFSIYVVEDIKLLRIDLDVISPVIISYVLSETEWILQKGILLVEYVRLIIN